MANVESHRPAPGGDETAPLRIELAWSPAPREMRTQSLRLAAGATIADALRACGWPELQSMEEGGRLVVAVWGKARPLACALADGDRVEVLRPLEADPMDARRARFEAAGGVKALRKRKHAAQAARKRRVTGSSAG